MKTFLLACLALVVLCLCAPAAPAQCNAGLAQTQFGFQSQLGVNQFGAFATLPGQALVDPVGLGFSPFGVGVGVSPLLFDNRAFLGRGFDFRFRGRGHGFGGRSSFRFRR